MNYYEHHLGDWAAATGHLTWDEDMAYTRLLRAYYHHEQAIPEGQQYRLAKASTPAQRKAVDQVLSEFFELRDGRYHQKRAEAEIARFQDKQRKAKASAEARWAQSGRNANASPKADANAMRTHSEGNALQTPDTRHQTPDTKSREARATRLPTDWVLPEHWERWAKAERPDLDIATTACKFRDYWVGIGGAKGRKLDWPATWRNWVREERAQVGKHPKQQDAETAYARQMREKYEKVAPSIAAKRPGAGNVIEMEVRNVAAAKLG